MILGKTCTRNCRFCAVQKGEPTPIDPGEPSMVATAAQKLGLKHVVVTSVTRDDLADGGASHFAQTITALQKQLPNSTVEVLIPDFEGNLDALKTVIAARPKIINHNIETVPALYETVRPMAVYERSLELLKRVKEYGGGIFSKSGLMVGLGETKEEVLRAMDDLIEHGCDILTIGQYLRPSKKPTFGLPSMSGRNSLTNIGKSAWKKGSGMLQAARLLEALTMPLNVSKNWSNSHVVFRKRQHLCQFQLCIRKVRDGRA